MAQLVFSSIGQAAGSALLPNGVSVLGQQVSGAAIGQFVGSVAGAAVDSYLLAPRTEGPRVSDIHVTESREGASIPNVYGRMRVGGNVIWAARFKEKATKEGGKGGPSHTSYAYSLSFAVGLCEGEISRVSRIWANGELMDLSKVNWRVHTGGKDQAADALIEAVETEAPAFRGLAYVVFEDLPLDAFGMRMPQLSFEVMRPVARDENDVPRMEEAITSVNMIPGSGEFAYATDIVRRVIREGEETPENMHNGMGESNFIASLEQAMAELPNLAHVNLIIGWFGNDLRCGECLIRPGVEIADKETYPLQWHVAGQNREHAYLISQDNLGRSSYGGTPDDASVLQAIAALKQRGIRVTLYPFLFMDVPPANGLPDPYGSEEQAAFPWRGRITCSQGAEMSAQAQLEVDAFFGDTLATDFDGNQYQGSDAWRYRRFILHYADLARRAGGVDAFLIGAEMVGLTRVRSARGTYPATNHWISLAEQVRLMVGASCKISYAADWTEYGAYVPQDGRNDTDFPLDDLWASPDIDFIGVDWYPPMADWRNGNTHLDALAGWSHIYDSAYLSENIEGGEAYDWYYANAEDRLNQIRTPITDAGYGEAWVYRQKDIRNWHRHLHYPRVGGVRAIAPTRWVAGEKPLRFIEFGCPAVDKGPNQPNVFYDPKSSENALPYNSSGARDDVVQRHVIEGFCEYWRNDPILDGDGISIWAWDARPFPHWPTRSDIWGDGDNWTFGHWLNGRVGVALLKDVVTDLAGRSAIALNGAQLQGIVSGYGIDRPMSLRDGLEPLKLAYEMNCVESESGLVFSNVNDPVRQLDKEQYALDGGSSIHGAFTSRQSMEAFDASIRLKFIDAGNAYQSGVVSSDGRAGLAIRDVSLPLVLDASQAGTCAERFRQLSLDANESAKLTLSLGDLRYECGDLLSLEGDEGVWRVEKLHDGDLRRLQLVRHRQNNIEMNVGVVPIQEEVISPSGRPHIVIVDGPPLPDEELDARPLVFAYAKPWSGPVVLKMGADESLLSERARIQKPSVMGRLLTALPAGENGRWFAQSVEIQIGQGQLDSVSELAVLNGANALLVETLQGWEVLQFQYAELIGVGKYKVSRFLRAQQGSDSASKLGAEIGAQVIFLNGQETRIELKDQEFGLDLIWRAGGEGVPSDFMRHGKFVWQKSAFLQWPPCHLNSKMTTDGLELSWIGKARIGGDVWGNTEQFSEYPEVYRVQIFDEKNLVRMWQTDISNTIYPAAQIMHDFPNGGQIIIEVSQLGFDGIAGHVQTIVVTI
ncbi:baseplate multidomain protein megatron [Hirschia litorea]|uniref:Glycoside hydrolase/phage tail family protein n=1 Tax=Hirschia litorea TaxID=1199156 RepID=A0ABW2IJ43_9PROT